MDNNFNEMASLIKDINSYLDLVSKDFEISKKELVDVARFSNIETFDRMAQIAKVMEQNSNMYRNAKNFLIRLKSISDGITLDSSEEAIAKCVSDYLILKHSNEYSIVVDEMNKRFDDDRKMGL